MKLKDQINIPAFLQAIQKCEADVLFVTLEGDRLNLKSTLSQFVFTAVIAGSLKQLEGAIELQQSSDVAVLSEFITD